jgi:hypothetical protein
MPSHLQCGCEPDLWKSNSWGRSCSATPRIVPESGLFALSFYGRGEQQRFHEVERQLREVLKRAGRAPSGPALYAQYNSPGAFPPLRRNEVILPLEPR